MSKKPTSYWNYRIVTKLNSYILRDETVFYRTFSIAEVYYKDKQPNSCGTLNVMQDIESFKGLKWANKKIQKAFKKPILDLDNNFKKWKNTH